MLRAVCIAILSVLPMLAFADVKTDLAAIDKRFGDCTAKARVGEVENCLVDASDATDKVLDRVYNSFAARLKQLPPEEDRYPREAEDQERALTYLEASQRAWTAFRQAECKLQRVRMLGGSGERLEVESCWREMTRDRARSLDELFSSSSFRP